MKRIDVVDTTPREWAPERAQAIKADARRAFWRQTARGLAVFTAGWCVLAAVPALAAALPSGIAAALAVVCVCAVAAGEVSLFDLDLQEAFVPWVLGAIAAVPLVIGVLFGEVIPLMLGLVILGVVSGLSVIGYARSYRRIVPR